MNYPPPPHQVYYFAQQVQPPSPPLESNDTQLIVRQEPKEALVLLDNKEKTRKPIDPPPVVQLHVAHNADQAKNFLQSPYLFVVAALWRSHQDGPDPTWPKSLLAGNISSSIHRLKDQDNKGKKGKDGGYFVFGDVSVRLQGTFRLHFTLYDLRLKGVPSEAYCLTSVTSKPFKVIPQKEFKGLDESTYLSRAFSDQGVRLRLRKEPRSVAGRKRALDYDEPEEQEPNHTPPAAPYHPVRTDSLEDHSNSPLKRQQMREVNEQNLMPPFQTRFEDQGHGSYPSYPQAQLSIRPASYGLQHQHQNLTPQHQNLTPQYAQESHTRVSGYPYSSPARYEAHSNTTQSYAPTGFETYDDGRPDSSIPGLPYLGGGWT